MVVEPFLERLITHHPVCTPDQRLLGILVDEKFTPTPLAAVGGGAEIQVMRVLHHQRVIGPGGASPATRPGILPRFRRSPREASRPLPRSLISSVGGSKWRKRLVGPMVSQSIPALTASCTACSTTWASAFGMLAGSS